MEATDVDDKGRRLSTNTRLDSRSAISKSQTLQYVARKDHSDDEVGDRLRTMRIGQGQMLKTAWVQGREMRPVRLSLWSSASHGCSEC